MSLKVLDVFKSRRSIWEYSPKEVPDEVLHRILGAARWAPSAHNAQPWRFIVIRDPTTKRKLAKAMANRWNKDMTKNDIPAEIRESRIRTSIQRFTSAPTLIIACLTMNGMDEYSDRRRQKIERAMAVQSVAAAIQNMLLAAHAEGLGSCWFCAPLFCQGAVRRVLRIPHSVDPQALITMGYPLRRPNPPFRKPLREIVHHDHWRQLG